jgi:hypothetical protein
VEEKETVTRPGVEACKKCGGPVETHTFCNDCWPVLRELVEKILDTNKKALGPRIIPTDTLDAKGAFDNFVMDLWSAFVMPTFETAEDLEIKVRGNIVPLTGMYWIDELLRILQTKKELLEKENSFNGGVRSLSRVLVDTLRCGMPRCPDCANYVNIATLEGARPVGLELLCNACAKKREMKKKEEE